MMLPLPTKFDANEIFIILATVFAFVLMFVLPRRISVVTFTIIWTSNIFLALLADVTIAVKPYDFYFTVDGQKYELFDLVLNTATYPTIPYFVVNFYRRIHPRGLKLLMYVIFCAGVASALEWTSVQFHVFTYTGWKLYLSFLVYIVVFAANIWLSNFIEKRHPYKSSLPT